MCDIDCSPTEPFQGVHRGHGWGLDRSSSDHHVQKGSDAALRREEHEGACQEVGHHSTLKARIVVLCVCRGRFFLSSEKPLPGPF